ncbi:MAG: CcmD family protein [Methanosarcinales archaeon]|nr:CcmD family protein [Methanosarcinales archaeon]HDJ38421.1 CcmD family protein [Methanosarcinales archaeon]
MNYLLYAFAIVWIVLGLYIVHLLLARSRSSRRGGRQDTHG